MANNFQKADLIGIRCWNAYIDSNTKEPDSGTQFQRWTSINPSYREHISYSKAYAIFDQFKGRGAIPISDNQTNKQNQSKQKQIKPSTTRKVCVQLPQTHAQEQTRDVYYNKHRSDAYNYNVYNVHKVNNAYARNAHDHNVQNIPKVQRTQNIPNVQYNQYYVHNESRSRAQSAHKNKAPEPSNYRQRANTCSSPEDLEAAVRKMVFSAYDQRQNGPQLAASKNIKAVPLAPKVAKDELLEFLIRYDLRDIQHKLRNNHIQLKHLQCMETNDLNALCAHLQLNISEKIRFSYAVKDLLRKNVNNIYLENGLKQSQSHDAQRYMMSHAVLSDEECDDNMMPTNPIYLKKGKPDVSKTVSLKKYQKNLKKVSEEPKKVSEEPKKDELQLPDLPKAILFLTGNKGKLKEVQNYLGDDIKPYVMNYKIDLPEIQGDEEEILSKKLTKAMEVIVDKLKGDNNDNKNKKTNVGELYILVEDTSLYLGQYSKKFHFPGPFCKYLLKANGCQGFIDMIKNHEDKSCVAQCLFGLLKVDLDGNPQKPLFFKGECKGKITDAKRGDDGFGWDPIFEFDGNKKTFAEMSTEEKNKISHRANALKELKVYLEKNIVDSK